MAATGSGSGKNQELVTISHEGLLAYMNRYTLHTRHLTTLYLPHTCNTSILYTLYNYKYLLLYVY